MTEESLLKFPCDIPIKVFGRNDATFRSVSSAIVRRHYATIAETSVSEKPSRNGAYLSLTFVVRAQSRAQVDALYRELTASNDIVMVL